MRLAELKSSGLRHREHWISFVEFSRQPVIASLGWPDDVLEQWLYDHANNTSFIADYGAIDLMEVRWTLDSIAATEIAKMPTGPSDRGCIEEYAENPSYWIGVRHSGVHVGVASAWETRGTWKRAPLFIERSFLDASVPGLQVLEGRTRVGILRGRLREGSLVAERHLAWVGRAKTKPGCS